MIRWIEQSMRKMLVRTREIFVAHRLDCFGYAEIVARTALCIMGVEKQMSRAIAHLGRALVRVDVPTE